MEKLVITKDTLAIESEVERCPHVCKILGTVLTKLQEWGYSPDLDKLEQTLHNYCSIMLEFDFEEHSERIISNYLKQLTIDSNHTDQKILGLKLKKEKFYELLEINHEEIKTVLTLLTELSPEDWRYFNYTDFNKEENKVVLNPNYKTMIDDLHTVYAVGKKQIEVTKLLWKVCDGLTELEKVTGQQIHRQEVVPGIRWINGRGQLDVHFIRKY